MFWSILRLYLKKNKKFQKSKNKKRNKNILSLQTYIRIERNFCFFVKFSGSLLGTEKIIQSCGFIYVQTKIIKTIIFIFHLRFCSSIYKIRSEKYFEYLIAFPFNMQRKKNEIISINLLKRWNASPITNYSFWTILKQTSTTKILFPIHTHLPSNGFSHTTIEFFYIYQFHSELYFSNWKKFSLRKDPQFHDFTTQCFHW